MPPFCDLPVDISKITQTGKEWAKREAALLPPDGGAGCGYRKEFPWVWFLDVNFLAVLLKIARVVQRTRRVDTLEPLIGWKVACLC